MKFAIGSDFHLDVNERYPFMLESDRDAFYLCAGDIAGVPDFRDKWLQQQIERGYRGVFVSGNHKVYHDEPISMEQLHDKLRGQFADCQNGFKFLENDCVFIESENILIIGCTLWTDFMLDGFQVLSGDFATKHMNDYGFKCIQTSDGMRRMCWQDTVKWFADSISYIENTIKEYPNARVVLLTHHGPSRKSVGVQFMNSVLSAAFVSNLEPFIHKHPEIKLWVHGHTHSSSDYMIDGCRVVCNPRGYVFAGEDSAFNKNLIIEI